MLLTLIKWFVLLVLVLGLTPVILVAGVYIPTPGLSPFTSPEDKSLLEQPSVFRLKGRLYVVGGYHTKNVPVGYQLIQPSSWFGSEVPDRGWHYDRKKQISKQVYVITDPEEAYIIEHSIDRSRYASLFINPDTWKTIGTVNSWNAIRDSRYYCELNGRVYAVGGTGYNAEEDEDVQYTDVWMSEDGINWSRTCDQAPWTKADFIRRNHSLTVADGAIYLTGGFGTNSNGQDGQMDYRDIWKSEDSAHWQLATVYPQTIDKHILKIKGRYFYTSDSDILYVSEDRITWQKLCETGLSLGILDDKLAMIVPNDSQAVNGYDLYTSTDGTSWQHSKTGKPISWIKLEEDYDYNYRGYKVVEFKGSLWLIGQGPGRIFQSRDGHRWVKVNTAEQQGFPSRTDAGVAVFKGAIWVIGGSTNDGVSLGDIWKSDDGRNWQKITDHAPWGLAWCGDLVTAKGRLYFVKKGTRWDPESGIVGAPIEIWSTADGRHWQRESGQSGKVVISAYSEEDLGKIDRGIETRDGVYFFDEARYQLFFREHSRDIALRTFGLRGLDFGTVAELRMKGERPIFVITRGHTIYTSFDLHSWDQYDLESKLDEHGEKVTSGFLTNYDDDIKYQPVIFNNALLLIGVDFRADRIYSAQMVVDPEKELIRQVVAEPAAEAARPSETKSTGPVPPDTAGSGNDQQIDAGTFRLKVVEHLSWESYHGPDKGFLLGDAGNKPIVGMAFTIKLPDGSSIEKKTDASGGIEIKGLPTSSLCDVAYSPEGSPPFGMVFYEKTRAVHPRRANPTGQQLVWEKSGLMTGKTHLFSVQ